MKGVAKMASYGSNRGRLWLVLMMALGSALVSLVAFVQGESLARADEQEGRGPQIVPDPRIVGGTAVPNGKYPFMAMLITSTVRGEPNSLPQDRWCGGTLIDKNSVLTAAHCLTAPRFLPVDEPNLRVVVGRTVLSSSQGQMRDVKRIFVHPDFTDSPSSRFDAAVLKLSSPVSGITPIKLATAKQNYLENPGRTLTVAGWGTTNPHPEEVSYAETLPDRMRQVRVPVVSDSRAERFYDALYGPSTYIPPIMVAAGKKGKSGCYADSGGPLFDSGSRIQIGIESFGHPSGCAMARYPSVYTEVNNPNIRNFILDAARR
jgi:secreted trypsin-like serine protease